MITSDGSGMHADSIAIRMTMPKYPVVEITATIQDATAEMIWSIIGVGLERSAPLAGAAAFEDDDLAPCRIVDELLRHLLGDAEEALAAVHFLPDVVRADARRDPQHDEVIDQVGAFFDDGFAVAVHGVDDDLDCLFGQLFRHLAAARTQQPRGPRRRRIVVPAGERGLIEA